MTDGPDSRSELAELRQGVYRFFAGALLPPDPERVELLRAAAETLASTEIDQFAFSPAWRTAAEVFLDPPLLAQLQKEYASLFVSPSGSGTCPPLESYYGAAPGKAPLVAGQLQHEYARYGLDVRPDLPVPSDHASVQLEVMSSLCHDEAHAWADGRDRDAVGELRKQWHFLDGHLARWVPAWVAHVQRAAPSGPGRLIAEATRVFLHHDLDLVTFMTRAEHVRA